MKHLLGLMTFFLIGSATAQQTVQVVWPFAPGGTQANMIRQLIDNANNAQKEYRFQFVNKQGAGGSVAANSVLNESSLSIIVNAAVFYTRPHLYKEAHDIEKFDLLLPLCEQAPFALFSKKYKSMSELKGKSVTVGIIPGSPGHLFMNEVSNRIKDVKFVNVPYKDTIVASTDMIGQHVDVSLDLLNVGTLERMPKDVTLLAVSGKKYENHEPISNLAGGFWFHVPKTVDKKLQKDLHRILTSSFDSKVKDMCKNDLGTVNILSFDKLESHHAHIKNQWKDSTVGVKVE